MIKEKTLTLEFVSNLLIKKGQITEDQKKEIMIKGETQRARLFKAQEGFAIRNRGQAFREPVSTAEVIASYDLERGDGSGKSLSEDYITELIAEEIGIPYKKIDPLKLDMDLVTSQIPRAFAQKHVVVPVDLQGDTIILAMADPHNDEAIDDLKRTSKYKFSIVLASKSDILKVVREFYGFRSSISAAQKEKEGSGALDLNNLEQYVKLKGQGEIEATDQHVVNAVEYMLRYAYDQKASDIHIEPKRDSTPVRIRIDGILHEMHKIPKAVHPSIVSRIKMLSRMDIAEKRRPQDGRIKTEFKGKEVELRISTLPTAFGEKVVIRIFDPDILLQQLGDLGFYEREYDLLMSYLMKTHGIVLVTGPTGSGKTTTLYSSLKKVASPEVNIVTIEDPIEMVVDQFNQVNVQPKIGVDFASTLRTILRQDPDIIMVGEIRDPETANNAVQASLTGHLVLSTLHTNDAPPSVARLLDLGVPKFLISSTILGIMAQRLVRKICKNCVVQRQLTENEVNFLTLQPNIYTVNYGEGCVECRGTGYKGRDGIFELMHNSENIQKLISEGADSQTIGRQARSEGMLTLRESAIKKMLEGVTTYEEVISITSASQ